MYAVQNKENSRPRNTILKLHKTKNKEKNSKSSEKDSSPRKETQLG